MTAYLQHNKIGLRDLTVAVTVPDNDIARLMYYFESVCYTIEYDDSDVQRYRNYAYWSSLSHEE
ncbi:unnamed protein product, partial [Rotaria sp. Silwood2]